MVAKYKLVMVDENEGMPDQKMCDIGKFDSEMALIKWLEENKGELEKC